MKLVIMGTLSTLGVIYIIPFIVYSVFSVLIGAKIPEGASPIQFLISVLIVKLGTAIAITSIFYLSKNIFYERWLLFSFLWWVMFILGEFGELMLPTYSWKEAFGGIVSETIYTPLSIFILRIISKQS
ncbi:hypothetical protein CH352_18935 [Leptospira hartskeerlii]|uniref:Uncharacterized protein n=1 Tax=Leptospira hartskeerlii TaxID=2023177 RepID=A0A2M9X855_9LEPT|nr:hypothetical protein [Leptospira hartskeerlii]PJZ23877.1 hypothetical protein CH357_18905 [Leptospira hartskeerlii]PJZ31905.1 hypothetical protein CH352_18935 [Leptospira hartskeerlii]